MSARPIEPIMAALWALLAPSIAPGQMFLTGSRRLQHVNDYALESMPAIFQNQKTSQDQKNKNGIQQTYYFVDWFVYVPGNDTDAMSPLLNEAIDVARAALSAGRSIGKQTLGGLVEDVYVEGRVEFYEGVLQDRAAAIIPITIVAPSTP